MACKTKTYQVSRNVWSDGTTTGIYHSMLRLTTAEWAKARVSLIGEGSSGLATVSTAAAYGDDESDFNSPSPADFPSTSPGATTLTANGSVYGTAYGDISRSTQLVDFGVKVQNTSGSKMEHIRVTLLVDVAEEM